MSKLEINYATFSGVGEPTLAKNLGEAIQLTISTLDVPVAVLTNSSLMCRADVREELALADTVVAKLDAPNDQLLAKINRPYAGSSVDEIVEALKSFRRIHRGKLALQIMFVEANREAAPELARIASELAPDEIQINTPLRPCAVKPLPPEELDVIRREFAGLEGVTTVYEQHKTQVSPVNLEETLRRRPEL